MIKAFKLEWLKLRHYKVFWIILSLYLLTLLVISSAGPFLLQWLKSQGADIEGLDPTLLPIYDFPDIWQNITWLAGVSKVLLSFVVVISVSNDISYNTLRQNIIDGISKKEYIMSKMMLILFLSILSTAFLFAAGVINGLIYSNVYGVSYILSELEFLAAYAYEIIIFCTMTFLLSLLIKKAGFVIVILFLYSLVFEPIITMNFLYNPYLKDTMAVYAPFLPVNAINSMIPVPFPKYILREIEDNVPLSAVLISTVWMGIYTFLISFILNKRDLK
ncbi:MAG: hypothetical protein KI790_06820 [Cyclobacteriaceae bacterium]|nr:hypothetical protein [Cyclobacteriaceae bacterium HetDA_MAG_MS6]